MGQGMWSGRIEIPLVYLTDQADAEALMQDLDTVSDLVEERKLSANDARLRYRAIFGSDADLWEVGGCEDWQLVEVPRFKRRITNKLLGPAA